MARPERFLGGAEWAHRPLLRRTIPIGVCCTALALVLVSSRRGDAVCNVIPGTTQTFRATQTTIDRPFASPGDVVTLEVEQLGRMESRVVPGTPLAPLRPT